MSLRKNQGFSLVEIMVGVGMLGLLALAVTRLTVQSEKSSTKLKVDSDVTFTLSEMNSLLSDPKKCKVTFDGTGTPPSLVSALGPSAADPSVIEVKGRKFNTIADGGTDGYGSSHLKIEKYELVKNGEEADLVITFQKKRILSGQADGPQETFTRRIAMYVEWNPVPPPDPSDPDAEPPPPTVKECRSLANSTSLIWTRGEGDDIYYKGGKVGIQTANPEEDLHVVGNVLISETIKAKTFLYSSDERLKKNIEKIIHPIEKILALRGVTFDWKSNGESDYGFIAQEVQKELPEIVNHDRKTLTVEYAKIIPFLVEAIKKQEEQIKELEHEIKKLSK